MRPRRLLTGAVLGAVWLLSAVTAHAQITPSPAVVTVAPGQTSVPINVDLAFQSAAGGTGMLAVTFLPAGTGIATLPGVITYAYGPGDPANMNLVQTSTSFRISTTSATAPGTYTATITNPTHPSGVAVVTLVVVPSNLSVDFIVPGAVSAGTRSVLIRIAGKGFPTSLPGSVTVSFSSIFVTVESTRVVSSKLIEILATVRSDSPPTRADLVISDLSGLLATVPGILTILQSGSAGAPLGVTSITVVSPRPGAQIPEDQSVQARGLLAVTGSGTVTGSWLLDGVVFDRFTARVQAGLPTPVSSSVPIPLSFRGRHSLQLDIDSPQRLSSPPVDIVQTAAASTQLRILGPRPDRVWGATPPEFEWQPVPGVMAYEIEFERPGQQPALFRTTDSRWTPSRADREEIGTGARRWRVQSVLPGEIRQEPTPWRGIHLLPDQVALTVLPPAADGATGGLDVRWEGGSPGMAYLLEILPENGTTVIYSAMTARESHLVPPGTLADGVYRFRVTAMGPDQSRPGSGETISRVGTAEADEPLHAQDVAPPPGGGAPQAPADTLPPADESPSTGDAEVTRIEPPDGGSVWTLAPRIHAEWSRSVEAGKVVLRLDKTDVTSLAEVTPTSITYLPPEPLSSQEHHVELLLEGRPTRWTFRVAIQAPESPGAGETVSEPARPRARGEWAINSEGGITASWGDEAAGQPQEKDSAHAAVSGRLDYRDGPFSAQTTADVASTQSLSSEKSAAQDNENWIVQLGLEGRRTAGYMKAGYLMPGFLEGSEFLNAGLIRGGVEASVARESLIRGTVYQSFEPQVGSITSGDFSTRQNLRAAAIESGGGDRRYMVRLIGIDVANEEGLQSGGDSSSYGLLGSYTLSPGKSFVLEWARSRSDPSPMSFDQVRSGNAARLGFQARGGSYGYSVFVRHVDAGFDSPANRGFTAGGRSDRDEIQASASKQFGTRSLSLGGDYQHSGGTQSPEARSAAATATFSSPLGRVLSLSLSGNASVQRAAKAGDFNIGAIDRSDRGTAVTLIQRLGAYHLSETLSGQWHVDDLKHVEDTATYTGALSAGGPVTRNLLLAGSANATRTIQDRALGDTTTVVVSAQPAYVIPAIRLAVQPLLSYTNSRNDVEAMNLTTEQYSVRLAWKPRWLSSAITFDVSSGWSRTRDGLPGTDESFHNRYSANLLVQWGRTGGQPSTPGSASMESPGNPAEPPPGVPPPLSRASVVSATGRLPG
ncbi:MAG TPA: hypothetical protein VNI57_01645 [Candidatus Saccharimonadales bacterium]|nr:hypothetical protein [Candidatus Saccharimonadales bacterium]